MKRIVLMSCLALLFVSFSACGKQNKEEVKDAKRLVVYFSASGVTRHAASMLAKEANADLFEIKAAQPYTEADLDWRDEQSRSTLEMKDKTSRPAIAEKIDNIQDYDVIYVGFPIWWGTAPTIINTFIESYDLRGKELIPFATSGTSSIEQACINLKEAYPEIHWKTGKLMNHLTESDIADWLAK